MLTPTNPTVIDSSPGTVEFPVMRGGPGSGHGSVDFELVFELRSNVGSVEPDLTFRQDRPIFPITLEEGSSEAGAELRRHAIAAWREATDRDDSDELSGRKFLMPFTVGGTSPYSCFTSPCEAEHVWWAVLFDNHRSSWHHVARSGWHLVDASAYFLTGGDCSQLATWPIDSLSGGALTAAVNNWEPTGAIGYSRVLTPRLDPSDFDVTDKAWSDRPHAYRDIRVGTVQESGSIFTLQGRSVVDQRSNGTLQNWRVIARPHVASAATTPIEQTDIPVMANATTPATMPPISQATQVELEELRRQVADLKERNDNQRQIIERTTTGLQGVSIDELKAYLIDQTTSHDGCDQGKTQFLTGTGLWSEDEARNIVCGSRDWIVSYSAGSYPAGSVTIKATSADEARRIFREQYAGNQQAIDDLLVNAIRSNYTGGIDVDDVEES